MTYWNPISHLYTYCKENSLYQSKSSDAVSHCCYNGFQGGKILVQPNKYVGFMNAFIQDVNEQNNNHCLSERISADENRAFRMFFDLDFVGGSEELNSKEYMQNLIKIINEEIKKFYISPKNLSSKQKLSHEAKIEEMLITIVASSQPTTKRVKKNNTTINVPKVAFHLYQPYHFVDSKRAKIFQCAVVEALIKKFGQREANNAVSWEEVIDSAVYGVKSGLRMIYNNQFINCSRCEGKGKLENNGGTCVQCKGKGKIDGGRPYIPIAAFEWDGNDNETINAMISKSDKREIILLCTITIDDYSLDGRNVPIAIPCKDFVIPADASYEILKIYNDNNEQNNNNKNSSTRNKINVPHNNRTGHLILESIKKMHKDYENVQINHVLVDKSKKSYMITLRGSGHYCANVRRLHTKASVYFIIRKDRLFGISICQKCFSTCPRIKNKKVQQCICKDFKGRDFKICRELENLLFPNPNSEYLNSNNNNDNNNSNDNHDVDASDCNILNEENKKIARQYNKQFALTQNERIENERKCREILNLVGIVHQSFKRNYEQRNGDKKNNNEDDDSDDSFGNNKIIFDDSDEDEDDDEDDNNNANNRGAKKKIVYKKKC